MLHQVLLMRGTGLDNKKVFLSIEKEKISEKLRKKIGAQLTLQKAVCVVGAVVATCYENLVFFSRVTFCYEQG